jgi:hypothetical protein
VTLVRQRGGVFTNDRGTKTCEISTTTEQQVTVGQGNSNQEWTVVVESSIIQSQHGAVGARGTAATYTVEVVICALANEGNTEVSPAMIALLLGVRNALRMYTL